MKRLILMRHAKSGWSDITATDHERSLNKRGIKSASAMGAWLRERSLYPDHILCSDANRTRETLALLELADVPTTFTRSLYLAEADVMARHITKQTGDCLLMVAHNPGCAILASRLLKKAPSHFNFDTFPTCATLVAEFNIENWEDLRMGTGAAIEFIVPRALID